MRKTIKKYIDFRNRKQKTKTLGGEPLVCQATGSPMIFNKTMLIRKQKKAHEIQNAIKE